MDDVGRLALDVVAWVGVGLVVLVGLVVIGSFVIPALTRRATDRWGATDDEVAMVLPGDELVVHAQQSATRGVSIDAPPALVRALVRQQGYRRAGWHGWDWFYRATGSAEFVDGHFSTRIVPELQDIAPGDRVWINSAVSYEVVADDPGAFVLWSGGRADGTSLAATEAAQADGASTSWVWVFRELEGGGTRLLLRIRADMRGQGAFVAWLFDAPLDFGGALFAAKTLSGIRRTAQALASAGTEGSA